MGRGQPIRMNPQALERRCKILRFIASKGGVLSGIKVPEFADAVGIPFYAFQEHLTWLKTEEVIHVARKSTLDKGGLPNVYTVLHDEEWLRVNADRLTRAVYERRKEAQREEDDRVHARDALRDERTKMLAKGRERHQRAQKGLPADLPAAGEPEPRAKEVSDAVKREMVKQAVRDTPADELIAWGA